MRRAGRLGTASPKKDGLFAKPAAARPSAPLQPLERMTAQRIKEHFKDRFGAEPTVTVRAPGRINLIGEHTDYNGGLVLPAAIDRAIWLAAAPRDDGRFRFFAADLGELFEAAGAEVFFQKEKSWANYLLGVVSEARRDGLPVGGLDVAFGGDVPLGAGLSSSAALESGMGFLMNETFQLGLSKMDIVRLAQRGENEFVGMKCGIMDMFASVMGREGHVVRLDCRSLAFEHLPFRPDGLCLLLLDSGVKHQLVDSQYNARREECEAGVSLLKKHDPAVASLRDVSPAFLEEHRAKLPKVVLKRCRFVVEEIERVERACDALRAGDFRKFGRLMYACHDGLNLLYDVCVPQTSFLVEQARSRRILGARQMGGGFGGCVLTLLKTGEVDEFVEEASAAYQRVFGLGLRTYPVRLADGVGRV